MTHTHTENQSVYHTKYVQAYTQSAAACDSCELLQQHNSSKQGEQLLEEPPFIFSRLLDAIIQFRD